MQVNSLRLDSDLDQVNTSRQHNEGNQSVSVAPSERLRGKELREDISLTEERN